MNEVGELTKENGYSSSVKYAGMLFHELKLVIVVVFLPQHIAQPLSYLTYSQTPLVFCSTTESWDTEC